MHNIKKYQDGSNIWGISTNIMNVLGGNISKKGNFKSPYTTKTSDFGDTAKDNALNSIQPIPIMQQPFKAPMRSNNEMKSAGFNTEILKPTNTIKPMDSKKLDGSKLTGMIAKDTASKATKINKVANFKSGMNIASQLADPILQVGEGIAKSFGAEFAEKDTTSGAVDAISGVASMFGPVGQGIGIGLKVLDTVDRAAGKNVKAFEGNTGTNSYSDFSTQGNKFRLTAGNKAKRAEADKATNQGFYSKAMGNVSKQKQITDASGDFGNQIANNTQNMLNGGFNKNLLLAKKGSKLEKLKGEKGNLISKRKTKEAQHGSTLDQIESLKQGGEINVIPSGALHAHKNNLEDINDEMTKKGIPVINIAEKGDVLEFEKDGKTPKLLAEGGEVIQHAEIEREEIILTLTLTQKIEEFRKDGSKEAMIEAGKLLTIEIMENTEDNTGLMEKIIEKSNT